MTDKMIDNRPTELLCKLLEERGEDYMRNGFNITWSYYSDPHTATESIDGTLIVTGLTPEQAIAATLGSEYHGYEQAAIEAWENIKAWNTSTDHHPYEQRITGDGSDWGEIMRDAYDDLMASAGESCTPEQMRQLSDHIRAEMGSERTCRREKHGTKMDGSPKLRCSLCGYGIGDKRWSYCPSCGAKVVGK